MAACLPTVTQLECSTRRHRRATDGSAPGLATKIYAARRARNSLSAPGGGPLQHLAAQPLIGGEPLELDISLSQADGAVLGLHLMRIAGVVVVHSVDEGRAAALAGVRAADLLDRAGGQPLLGGTKANFDLAVRTIRESAATGSVRLSLRRGLFLAAPLVAAASAVPRLQPAESQ